MYHFKLFAVLLLFICLGISTQAAKKAKAKGTSQQFKVDLGNGDKVAIQVKGKKDVYTFRSTDKKLTQKGYTKATVLFDYSKNQGVVLVVAGKGKDAKCYYMDTPVSKADFKATLASQAGKDVTLGSPVALDGRGSSKSNSAAKKFLKTMPSARMLCKKAKVVELTTLDANADLTSTTNSTVYGLDADFTLVLDAPSSGIVSLPAGFKGKPGDHVKIGNTVAQALTKGVQVSGKGAASGGASNAVASGGASNAVASDNGSKGKGNNNKNKSNNKNKKKNNNKNQGNGGNSVSANANGGASNAGAASGGASKGTDKGKVVKNNKNNNNKGNKNKNKNKNKANNPVGGSSASGGASNGNTGNNKNKGKGNKNKNKNKNQGNNQQQTTTQASGVQTTTHASGVQTTTALPRFNKGIPIVGKGVPMFGKGK